MRLPPKPPIGLWMSHAFVVLKKVEFTGWFKRLEAPVAVFTAVALVYFAKSTDDVYHKLEGVAETQAELAQRQNEILESQNQPTVTMSVDVNYGDKGRSINYVINSSNAPIYIENISYNSYIAVITQKRLGRPESFFIKYQSNYDSDLDVLRTEGKIATFTTYDREANSEGADVRLASGMISALNDVSRKTYSLGNNGNYAASFLPMSIFEVIYRDRANTRHVVQFVVRDLFDGDPQITYRRDVHMPSRPILDCKPWIMGCTSYQVQHNITQLMHDGHRQWVAAEMSRLDQH